MKSNQNNPATDSATVLRTVLNQPDSLLLETASEEELDAVLDAQPVEVRRQIARDLLGHNEGSQSTEFSGTPKALSWSRLHEALALSAHCVPSDFADRVMAQVRAQGVAAKTQLSGSRPRASRLSWLVAILGACVLGAFALVSGSSGEGGESIVGTLLAASQAALLAGAGLVGATWSGVSVAVTSWMGESIALVALAVIALLGTLAFLARSLRRARNDSTRSR